MTIGRFSTTVASINKKLSYLKAPTIIRSYPVCDAINIHRDILVKGRISKRRELLQSWQECVDQLVIKIGYPLHSIRQAVILFMHHDRDEVVGVFSASLSIRLIKKNESVHKTEIRVAYSRLTQHYKSKYR